MKERMVVVKADEISSTIKKTGKIAIYGILFDFDKADIKPESAAALAEIATMLKENTGKKFLIVGHTDNQGGLEYNSSLSRRRAEAVVNALKKQYAVDGEMIVPVGVGMVAPVASNTDESGRAKIAASKWWRCRAAPTVRNRRRARVCAKSACRAELEKSALPSD